MKTERVEADHALHPCSYCGTMIDDDDCVESDIPAVNGPTRHSSTHCREYVHAAMRGYMRERDEARADRIRDQVDAKLNEDRLLKIAAIYNEYAIGGIYNAPYKSSKRALVEIGDALGEPWSEGKPK